MSRPLHPVQMQLLSLLKEHADDPLTIRELQELAKVSTTSLVFHHLQQLEKKGYLKRDPYNPRNYQVLESGPETGVAEVNLYGMARCGPEGSFLDGNPIDRIPLAKKLLSFPAADAFMVKAKGNSMEPKIYEGDLVVARKTTVLESGKMYVCVNDGECLIKVVREIEGKVFLESINRTQYPIFSASRDFFRIEGEVRHIISGRI